MAQILVKFSASLRIEVPDADRFDEKEYDREDDARLAAEVAKMIATACPSLEGIDVGDWEIE